MSSPVNSVLFTNFEHWSMPRYNIICQLQDPRSVLPLSLLILTSCLEPDGVIRKVFLLLKCVASDNNYSTFCLNQKTDAVQCVSSCWDHLQIFSINTKLFPFLQIRFEEVDIFTVDSAANDVENIFSSEEIVVTAVVWVGVSIDHVSDLTGRYSFIIQSREKVIPVPGRQRVHNHRVLWTNHQGGASVSFILTIFCFGVTISQHDYFI